MLFLVRYTLPDSTRIRSVEVEARSEDEALNSFHRTYGAEPRVLDIKLAV